jgi:hypothetical protein
VPRSPSADPHSTTTRRPLTRDREEAPLGERHLLGVRYDPNAGRRDPQSLAIDQAWRGMVVTINSLDYSYDCGHFSPDGLQHVANSN